MVACYDADKFMDVRRTVLLGVLGGAVAVWLASAATTMPRSAPPVVPATPRTVEVSGAELSTEIARLRDRLRPDAVPVERRDLFRYAAGRASSPVIAPPLAVAEPLPIAAAPPPFKLVGMAEDSGDAARTAILSAGGALVFVHEGDLVVGRFQAVRISPDAIELVDVNDRSTLRLVLK